MMRLAVLVALSVMTAARVASAAEPGMRFRLVNDGGHVIEKVFISPAGSPRWGDDLLKGRQVRPGQSVTLRVKGTCGSYDVRFVGQAGIEYMDEGVTFCEDDDVVRLDKTSIKKSKPSSNSNEPTGATPSP